jgi:hypothetical protein
MAGLRDSDYALSLGFMQIKKQGRINPAAIVISLWFYGNGSLIVIGGLAGLIFTA